MNRISVVSDFLSDADCNYLMSTVDDLHYSDGLEAFNANPDVLVVPDTNTSILNILRDCSSKAVGLHKHLNGFVSELYTNEAWVSLWLQGASADPHMDSHTDYEFLIYATVIYLNNGTEYDGGEIYFPNQDFTYKPKKGDAVLFPCGGHEYVHGVNKILSGNRYTIAMWHTRRGDKASPLLHPNVANSMKPMNSDWFSSYTDNREQE